MQCVETTVLQNWRESWLLARILEGAATRVALSDAWASNQSKDCRRNGPKLADDGPFRDAMTPDV